MLDKIAEINNIIRAEANITLKLLALVLSKPLKEYAEFPNWPNCMHVALKTNSDYLDVDNELIPMISNLAGSLAYKNRYPVDICIVRTDDCFCICVKYSDFHQGAVT